MMMMNNPWMEFGAEYNKMMNQNLELMGSYWRAQLEQNETLVQQNMEAYFQHLQRNVDFLQQTWTRGVKEHEELAARYRENLETLKTRLEAVWNEACKTESTKTARAGK